MSQAKHTQEHLAEVMAGFQIWGDFIDGEPYGTGHINDTYRVSFNIAGTAVHYLLQRINHSIFKEPERVMGNIVRVTEHLAARLKDAGEVSRRHLTVIPGLTGEPWVRDAAGDWWRLYLFIEKARTYDVIESREQAYQAARAFARFQSQLADMPNPRLHDTIPEFHNGPARLAQLESALAADPVGRAAQVRPELEFVERHRAQFHHLLERYKRGELPERITHNDTKINNVMLDDVTGEGICVIDLDTVMPGLALYDFGDMVRTATAATPEDERDLEKVYSKPEMFEALVRGYLAGGEFLQEGELEELVFAGQFITMLIGVRFLTDHINGDQYFRIHREGHNLDRARVQFRMAESMREQSRERSALVQRFLRDNVSTLNRC